MVVLTRRARFWALLLLSGVVACGGGRETHHPARGVVDAVQPEFSQVVIDHEDIPGLMPAMTMNFDVPDPELLARLAPGQVIEFTVEFTGRSYRVIEAVVKGEVEAQDGWARLGETLVRAESAPSFELTDQAGERVALADLSGRVVLLDFIYTTCPGPCPILTGIQVDVQRALASDLYDRVWFLSITLDPENDAPEALEGYARARGADLSNWSFLSGSVKEVRSVLSAYGVGRSRSAEGSLEHLVVRFLIDSRGRIVKRYLGLEHDPQSILGDLRALISASEQG